MDTSEIYIKMCDCEEIQKGHKPHLGDYYAYTHGKNGFTWAFDGDSQVELIQADCDDGKPCHYFDEKTVANHWLPRQDQLQEIYLKDMPDGTYQKIATLAETFHDYHEAYGYPAFAFSMEQLWLAFIMSECYQKTWSGTEWIERA